jgi:hypothetical protein
MSFYDEPKNVIWRWTPETKEFDENDPRCNDDIAEEYAIGKIETADAGIILWGKYRGEWVVNPWSSRPVIVKLLSELGQDIELPKHRNW